MLESHLVHLVCPSCQGDLRLSSASDRRDDRLLTAEIVCLRCGRTYPVVRGIPRFVQLNNYANSFGLQWTMHARTQYDSHSGLPLSERRFFAETGWPRNLPGERILEVGSGSGRFTVQALSTGALVVSVDYSTAVEVNYGTNGHHPNLLLAQADAYSLPVRRASFDKVFCFGMLQHTPDVYRAFRELPLYLKPGGRLALDVYKKTFLNTYLQPKYYMRRLIRSMDPERLYRLSKRWVDLVWPLSRAISKVPRLGPWLNWRLLVADHSGSGLAAERLKEWAYLDTFDMLSPKFDSPQRISTVRRWFQEAGLVEVDIRYGYNGIEGRARRGCDDETG